MPQNVAAKVDQQSITDVTSLELRRSSGRARLEATVGNPRLSEVHKFAPISRPECRIAGSGLQFIGDEYKNLHADFERSYAVALAESPGLVKEALRLRYRVYCLEQGYEDPAEQMDSMESDPYDQRAVHSLLIHRSSKTPIGTARLVLPSIDAPDDSFPIQRLLAQQSGSGKFPVPVSSSAEVSRFCISSALHKETWPAGQARNPNDAVPGDDRRHACLGLIRGLVHLSTMKDVRHWVLLAEATLLRLLRGFGFEFHRLGAAIDHHGKRFPCYAVLRDLLSGVRLKRPDVWEVVTNKGALLPERDSGLGWKDHAVVAFRSGIPVAAMAGHELLS